MTVTEARFLHLLYLIAGLKPKTRRAVTWTTFLVFLQLLGLTFNLLILIRNPQNTASCILYTAITWPVNSFTSIFHLSLNLTTKYQQKISLLYQTSNIEVILLPNNIKNQRRSFTYLLVVLTSFSCYDVYVWYAKHGLTIVTMHKFIMYISSLISSIMTFEYVTHVQILKLRLSLFKTHKVSKDLLAFRKVYDHLYNSCKLINLIYGSQILLKMLSCILDLISNTYKTILFLNELIKDKNKKSIISYNIGYMAHSLLALLTMVIITLTCQAASDESVTLMYNIQKLLGREDLTHSDMMQLQLFSKQIVRNKIILTVNGICVLNLSLMYSIIGVVTTYIIVLIQIK